jgi:ribulose-phosphate 3-epimerase
MLKKIEILRNLIQRKNYSVELEVDGGINLETAHLAVKAGANLLVAGSAIFGTPDPARAIQTLQQSIKNL